MNSRWQGYFVPQNSIPHLNPLTVWVSCGEERNVLWLYVRSKALLFDPRGERLMESEDM